MKNIWPHFLILTLGIMLSCGSDENLLDPNNPNPNPPGTPLTDEARLEVLERCDSKTKELNNLKTLLDKIQFIGWAMQQPEFRMAGFLDGSGVYAMFTDERVVLFVDTPLTDDPANGGRKADEGSEGNAEGNSGGRVNQTTRTAELPKSNRVTLYNGMGRYFNDNTEAIEKIFHKSPSRFMVERKDATIQNLKTVGGDGVFYFFTHGGGAGIPNPPPRVDSTYVMGLWTKNQVDAANEILYKPLLDEKKLAYMKATFDSGAGVYHYAITQEFIKEYMTFAENSIIYIDACNSFRDTNPSRAFRKIVMSKAPNEKATYFGWTFETNLFMASQASQFIFDRLLGTNTTGSGPVPIPKEDPIQRPFDLAKIYTDLHERGFDVCLNSATLKYQTTATDEILLAPTIEKLEIYESMTAEKSVLQIYGSFGSEKGKVTVNEIEMDNVEWDPSVIICSIPDGGQGYAGEVVVTVHDLHSNSVPLTSWEIKLAYSTDDNGIKLEGVIDLKLRADVHPRRTKPKETPSLPEYFDYSPSSGYSFEKSSQATYSISGQKLAMCNWVPCPNTFQESPFVRNGIAPYMKLTAPANAPKLLALYNWAQDRKAINLTLLHVNLPDITTTTYYQLADCPGEDQEIRSTQLTSFNFALPDYELNDVLQLKIADNYNIREGNYTKTLPRPWDPCDGSGTYKINVTWQLSHPQFEPTDMTPARVGSGD